MQEFTKQLQMQLSSEGSSSDEIHLAVISCIQKLLPEKNWNYIDIGCGNGKLADKLSRLYDFNSITAIDGNFYSQVKNKKIKFNQVNLETLADYQLGSYELITCTEVIEHLENPWQFARSISKILSPGGHLVITTPNPESLRSLICFIKRGYHCAFGEINRPAHKLALGVYDLTYLLNESIPIEKIDIQYIPNGLIPGLPIKWTSIAYGLNGKRFSDNYLIVLKKENRPNLESYRG